MVRDKGITLHPEKGVAAHMSVCRNCGKGVGLIMMGIRNYVEVCNNCNMHVYGGLDARYKGKCPGCGNAWNRDTHSKRRELDYFETVPAELCDDCMRNQRLCEEEVAKGGVFWKCSHCKSKGALKAGSDLAKQVREKLNIKTGPCGIEFDKEACPVCTGTVKEGEQGGINEGDAGVPKEDGRADPQDDRSEPSGMERP